MPKNWGTTGFAVNTGKLAKPMTTWKEFWDTAMAEGDGRTMVHDYQLTTIGNALKYFGFSFNSLKAGRAGQGRGTADQGQAASVRRVERLPALDARRRRLDDDVLDQ